MNSTVTLTQPAPTVRIELELSLLGKVKAKVDQLNTHISNSKLYSGACLEKVAIWKAKFEHDFILQLSKQDEKSKTVASFQLCFLLFEILDPEKPKMETTPDPYLDMDGRVIEILELTCPKKYDSVDDFMIAYQTTTAKRGKIAAKAAASFNILNSIESELDKKANQSTALQEEKFSAFQTNAIAISQNRVRNQDLATSRLDQLDNRAHKTTTEQKENSEKAADFSYKLEKQEAFLQSLLKSAKS